MQDDPNNTNPAEEGDGASQADAQGSDVNSDAGSQSQPEGTPAPEPKSTAPGGGPAEAGTAATPDANNAQSTSGTASHEDRDPEQYLFTPEPPRILPEDLNKLLRQAVLSGASDTTIQTNEPIIGDYYGRLYPMTKRRLNSSEVSNLLNSIYGPNGTTQLLSGTDLDSHFEVRPNRHERYRFRVNATGCQVDGNQGIQITMRTIPTDPPLLADLELPDQIYKHVAPSDGIVYITGSTGSGKSTLLSAIIRYIAENPDSNRKILTYESPIEFVYDNVQAPSSLISQSEIPLHLPSFAAGVRNALRRNPRLILVGECRDNETINACLEAAMTGHPVYTTLHTNGVAETVRRLVGGLDPSDRHSRSIDIIETMRMVVWQKLVPTVDMRRVALREYLVFTEDIRDHLLGIDIDNITQETRRLIPQYGQTILTDAQTQLDAGVISQRTFDVIKHFSDRQMKDVK